jgi:hypothetical protein
MVLARAGALGWCGRRRCGERHGAAGKGGRDQRDAEQVLGVHLRSFGVEPGSSAEGCEADLNAHRHQVSQPAPKPTLATVSTWPRAAWKRQPVVAPLTHIKSVEPSEVGRAKAAIRCDDRQARLLAMSTVEHQPAQHIERSREKCPQVSQAVRRLNAG